MTVKLAMAQIHVEGGRPDANLERAAKVIAEAAERGAQIVVLPECLDLGWTDPCSWEAAQPIPGPHSDRLAEAARRHGVHVVAGLVERAPVARDAQGRPRLYNSAVLIDPRGAILHVHRKINELDIAHEFYAVGDRLGVVETELGVLGIDVCADNFPDSLALGHVLARMGAQIILSPCAWAVPVDYDHSREPYGDLWRGAYRELARLYDLPVIGVSSVGKIRGGPWHGRKLIGCSLAMGGDGEIIAEGPYGEDAEAVLMVDIELRTHAARGTDVAEDLRRRGYAGP
ncbi:MAG: carbon-nitrogen hydrolase family protein [Planctomycetaceae bacterium]